MQSILHTLRSGAEQSTDVHGPGARQRALPGFGLGFAQRPRGRAQVLGTASGFTLPACKVQPTAFGDAPSPGAEQRPLACFAMLLPLLPGCSLTSLLEQRCAHAPA